jgi:hypothetical protein
MSRDTLNGTLVSRFADFTGVSCSSALPQFVKTERSDGADLACSQIGTADLITMQTLSCSARLELHPADLVPRQRPMRRRCCGVDQRMTNAVILFT